MAVATPNGVNDFFRYARTERAAIHPNGHSRIILQKFHASTPGTLYFYILATVFHGLSAESTLMIPSKQSPGNFNSN